MELLNYISPVLLFLTAMLGWWFGRRKQTAEIDSLAVSSSKVAVEALLATIHPLKQELEDLKFEVGELKELNKALVIENQSLQASIRQLRVLVQGIDDDASSGM